MSDRNPFTGQSTTGFSDEDADNNPFDSGRSAAAADAPAYGGKRPTAAESRKAASAAAVSGGGAVGAASSVGAGFSGATDEDLRLREENLKRREAELAAREQKVDAREVAIRNNPLYKEPNWPSGCLKLQYHDIDAEVPEPHRAMVRRFYAMVIVTWFALFFNFLVFMISYFAQSDIDVSADVLWSTIYLVLGVPGSWVFWYRNVYYATGQQSNLKWVGFFITFGTHWLLCIMISVAIPSCNGAGLLFMLKCFTNSFTLGGIFSLINTAIWGILLLTGTYYGKRAYSVWRAGGGSERLERETAAAKAMGSVAMTVGPSAI